MNTMSRRDFLRFAGLMFVSGLALPACQAIEQEAGTSTNPQIRFGKYLLQGTACGALLGSSDQGTTWQELVRFGESHAVLQLVEKNKQVYAHLSLDPHDFWLRSADVRKWFTV